MFVGRGSGLRLEVVATLHACSVRKKIDNKVERDERVEPYGTGTCRLCWLSSFSREMMQCSWSCQFVDFVRTAGVEDDEGSSGVAVESKTRKMLPMSENKR